MTREEADKVELAKRAAEAYKRRDLDTFFAEFATPDVEWWPAAMILHGSCYRGREGIEQFWAETAETFTELQAVTEEFRDLGDRVLVLARFQGRGRGSGAPVDAPIAMLVDFRGGRIWRSRVYLDRAEALRGAGVSEQTPHTPAL
ncbi:MAG TPA: nuclear transport factor 2 family protein [Solirubrobacteraceae bacterium]|nr:nuclear transport factor 2 family protein [Solirubrobacteraceae bacterium]